jgi:flagellin
MALSVLNNIPSLVAQNQLQVTNNNLQSTLFQLSSGSRINSGADDPAGLSIVNGLQANISALTQSSQNATDGVGQLQVADGALSQVTTLLNRAVTLATEAANGGLTTDQFAAITNEYASITSEINRIGQATNFNGTSVFQGATVANPNVLDSTAATSLTNATALTNNSTLTLGVGGNTYTFTAGTNPSTWYTGNATVNANTQLTTGAAITVANAGGGTYTFTAAPYQWSTSAGSLTLGSALTNGDTITVNSTGGAAVNFVASSNTVGDLITAVNTAGDPNLKAWIDGSGNLQIQSNSSHDAVTVTADAQSQTDLGSAITGAQDTVGDLVNQINNSGQDLTATIDANNHLNFNSTNGNITISANTLTQVGTLTATSTVQDLVNGINGSGLGVTASLVGVTNPNQLIETNKVLTGATSLAGDDGDTLTITAGSNTVNYTASATTKDPVTGLAGNNTVQGLIDTINASGTGLHAYLDGNQHLQVIDTNDNGDIAVTANGLSGLIGNLGAPAAPTTQLQITDSQNRDDLTVTNSDPVLGYVAAPGGNSQEGGNADAFVAPQMAGNGGAKVFISDGEVTNPLYNTITIQVGAVSANQIGSNATSLSTANLGTAAGAAASLTVINSAISDVAAMRGTIGAGINRLNSATNVINTQIQNLTSAQSSIQDANIGTVVANLSKYQVLEQTGISALAQANQNEQAVLKLLQ